MTCKACSLGKSASSVCMSGAGSEHPIFMFVGEAPSYEEDRTGELLTGKVANKLKELIAKAGLPIDMCRFETVVRCAPYDDQYGARNRVRTVKPEEVEACSHYLDCSILKYKPVVVVAMGNTALSYFCPNAPSILKAVGKRFYARSPRESFMKEKMVGALLASNVDCNMSMEYDVIELLALQHGLNFPSHKFTVVPIIHPASTFYDNGYKFEQKIFNDLCFFARMVDSVSESRPVNYEMFTNLDDMQQYCHYLLVAYRDGLIDRIVADIECNSLSSFGKKVDLFGFGVTHKLNFSRFIPYNHPGSPFFKDTLAQTAISKMWNEVFNEIPVSNHNVKFDVHWLYRFGMEVKKILNCTYLSSWTLFNDTKEHDLESLSTLYTPIKNHKGEMHMLLDDMKGTVFNDDDGEEREPNMGDIDIEVVAKYCNLDCDAALHLDLEFNRMMQEKGLKEAHYKYTIPDIMPAVRMERTGVVFDTSHNENVAKEYTKSLNGYHAKLYESGYLQRALEILVREKDNQYNDKLLLAETSGSKKPTKPKIALREITLSDGSVVESASLTSPMVKKILLYDVLEFVPFKPTERGKDPKESPSTDKEVLEECRAICLRAMDKVTDSQLLNVIKTRLSVLECMIEFNKENTIYSKYISKLPNHVNHKGMIHTSYGIGTTSTSRWSCSDPSLHTIPKKSPVKYAFKPVFKDGLLLFADYSQNELRVIAMISGDEVMKQIFRDGEDIHDAVARKIGRGRKEAKCFHPNTEVLTLEGWKRVGDVDKDIDFVAQAVPLDGNVEIQWVHPTDVFTIKNTHDCLLHLQNEGIDLSVTPNHRMLVWPTNKKNYKVVEAADFGNQRFWANAGMSYGGDYVCDDALLRLAVATQADGNLSGNRIRFGFHKQRKAERLLGLLESFLENKDYTFKSFFTKDKKSKEGTIRFEIVIQSSLANQILKLLVDGKQFGWNWLLLSLHCREVVLEEARYWDAMSCTTLKEYVYTNTNKQSLDVIQAIASITSRKTFLRSQCKSKGDNKEVFRLSVKQHNFTRGGNVCITPIPYAGNVVCLSVPSTFVLVRDNGIPVITGQSTNFGIAYQEGPEGLAAKLCISVDAATVLIDEWYEQFQGVKKWVNKQKKLAMKSDECWTATGFRRIITLDSCPQGDREKERRFVNSPIQGPASNFGSLAVALVDEKLEVLKYKSKLFTFVHDALGYSIYPGELYDIAFITKKVMESVVPSMIDWIDIPLKADMSCGPSWGEQIDFSVKPDHVLEFKGDIKIFEKVYDVIAQWGNNDIVSYKEEVNKDDDLEAIVDVKFSC